MKTRILDADKIPAKMAALAMLEEIAQFHLKPETYAEARLSAWSRPRYAKVYGAALVPIGFATRPSSGVAPEPKLFPALLVDGGTYGSDVPSETRAALGIPEDAVVVVLREQQIKGWRDAAPYRAVDEERKARQAKRDEAALEARRIRDARVQASGEILTQFARLGIRASLDYRDLGGISLDNEQAKKILSRLQEAS